MAKQASALLSLLFAGAIFGFFYAWICSTMWGLDQMDPREAISAMNAMNASVRNPVFFPAFFLTPVVLAGTAFIFFRQGAGKAAFGFSSAAAIYLVGALLPTAMVNVPMNEALATHAQALSIDQASEIWRAYSEKWQAWNMARTIASGLSLLLVG